MKIRCGYRLSYDCAAPTPMLPHAEHPARARGATCSAPETLVTDPPTPISAYTDGFGNRVTRVLAPPGVITISSDFLIADPGEPEAPAPEAVQHPVEDLPPEVLIFLLASRYCETEHLSDTAWELFGGAAPGWARVQAIVDYTHQRIRFGYPNARATRTAVEAHDERMGVCRDFAHLAVTACAAA